jgi:hypothetical protein
LTDEKLMAVHLTFEGFQKGGQAAMHDIESTLSSKTITQLNLKSGYLEVSTFMPTVYVYAYLLRVRSPSTCTPTVYVYAHRLCLRLPVRPTSTFTPNVYVYVYLYAQRLRVRPMSTSSCRPPSTFATAPGCLLTVLHPQLVHPTTTGFPPALPLFFFAIMHIG